MPHCYLALGGNVGDVEETFQTALLRLAAEAPIQVSRVSRTFRTRPVGDHAGGEFHNAAAEIETTLEPLALLDVLQNLERRAGRIHGQHWAPRPLDLDLIFYGDQIIDVPRLCVPHPACWYRRFVLDPLASIASDVRHPVKELTIAELRGRLLTRPLRLALAGSSIAVKQRLKRELLDSVSRLETRDQVEIVDWPVDPPGTNDPTILAWVGTSSNPDSDRTEFTALPIVPRLDASAASDAAAFLRDALRAALG